MTDPAPSPDRKPMQVIRGTLIVCDAVEQTISGKFMICGTYNMRHGRPGEPILKFPLAMYLRLQFEHAGTYPGEILIVDRSKSSTHKPLLHQAGWSFSITDPLQPLEVPCLFHEIEVECPVDIKTLAPGGIYALHLLVWLKVDGADVASSPLTVIFLAPQGPPHEHIHRTVDEQ